MNAFVRFSAKAYDWLLRKLTVMLVDAICFALLAVLLWLLAWVLRADAFPALPALTYKQCFILTLVWSALNTWHYEVKGILRG